MRSKNQLFYHPKSIKKPVVPTPIEPTSLEAKIPTSNWKDKYISETTTGTYKLEDSADDSELNRAIQLKSYDNTDIIEGRPGKLYFDKVNGVVKVFVSETVGWKTLAFEA